MGPKHLTTSMSTSTESEFGSSGLSNPGTFLPGERPRNRGISTLLMLTYASLTSFVGVIPGIGRGRASTTARIAKDGIELSTEFLSFRPQIFSIIGTINCGV